MGRGHRMANVAAAFPLKWLQKDTYTSKEEFIPSPDVIRSAWRTDTQITGSQDSFKERELQRWMPDEHTDNLEELSTDPQARMKSSGQWNQFEANAELFGMESTFKEDLSQYTTLLDLKKVPLSVQRKAERLAAEIERKGGSANRDYDNGNELDDAGDMENEEDRWSAVPRAFTSATIKKETVAAQQVPSTTQTKVPGAYFHIDGIGLVDEQVARATPWMLAGASERIASQQQHHPSQQYHAEERYCNQASCYAGPVQFCAWATPAAADTTLEQMSQHSSAPLSTVPQQQPASTSFATGAAVMVTGLTKLPAFNGRVGEVQSFDAEGGRYNVLIELQQDGGEARQLAKIRGQHLVALPSRPPLQ